MNTTSFQYSRLAVFDNLELFSSENETAYFPFHFHDHICVSLITRGTEKLLTPEQEFFVPSGYISITQFNEVHKNASLDDGGYSYRTIYVNPSLLQYFNGNKPVFELERAINDPLLYQTLERLIQTPGAPMQQWEAAFRRLTVHAVKPSVPRLTAFTIIDELLDADPAAQINTGWLAKQCCMSKYHFIREFKKAKGVTPQTYVMLRRLEHARKQLPDGMPIQEIAHINGFYDSSHFATAFRRYFGVTPVNQRK